MKSTLREYLKKHKLTLRAFSIISDIDQSQLSRYLNGFSKPTIESAYKIYRASNRFVKMEEWVDDTIKSKRYR